MKATPAADLAGLQFMGKVVAAFSHDFKNSLAIINENAGLLKDLTAMATNGRPPDLSRLETLAQRIGQQVQRADEMTRQVNRFAHSMDRAAEEVDLSEMLTLATALSRRPAVLQRVTLEVAPAGEPLRLTIFVFGLQRVLYECVQAVLTACTPGGKITLSATGSAQELTVAITPDSADGKDMVGLETVAPLAAALGGKLRREPGSIAVVWPRGPAAA
jgi:signal transduction histidine kinase